MVALQIDNMFRDIIETIREPFLVLDSDLKVLFANRSFINSFKVTPKETIGSFIYDLGNQQWNIPKLRKLLEDILSNNSKFDGYEIEHDFENIGHKIMLLNARRLIGNKTNSEMILLAIEDITERIKLKTLLEDSEERFRRLFETADDGILLLEKDKLAIHYANPAATAMLDYPNEEFIGNNLNNIGFPNTIDTSREILQTLDKHGIIHYKDVSLQKKNKQFIDTDIYMVDKAHLVQCNIRDIRDRKQVEKELEESLVIFQNLFNNSEVGMFRTRLDGTEMMNVNDKFLEIFGRTREEVIGKPSVIYWADPSQREEMIRRIKADGRVVGFECRMLNKKGEVRECITSSNLYSEEAILDGSIIDITERKKSEKALKESEEKYKAIVDNTNDGIAIIQEGLVKFANPALEKMTGFKLKDRPNAPITDFFQEEDIPLMLDRYTKRMKGDKIKPIYEYTIKRSDGSDLNIELSGTKLTYENKDSNLILIRDISERRQLESQLQQSQKMEAIGTLAGGVAHDFNNILTSIIGNCDLELLDLRDDDPLHERIEEIKADGERAASLTSKLLAFSRKQVIQPEILNLNELLTDLNKMLARIVKEDISIKVIQNPSLWNMEIDAGQVEQIIMNLVVNARDAMPTGGNITIETGKVDIDEHYLRQHGVEGEPGSYVLLAVSDTGIGMDKKIQNHIFEPFYTTKESGKGTGLGLSTVYGIVKQNNGFIWVYSEPGQGSTFKVYLPSVKDDVTKEEIKQIPVVELSGSETVLIVEDDNSLRKLVQKVLQQYGYKILLAENGEEALRVSKEHEESIELMITDVVMPKMSGRETAKRLEPLYPHMKVMYMSGYTDEAIATHGVLEPGLNFLEKPFTPKDLARKVREVLDTE